MMRLMRQVEVTGCVVHSCCICLGIDCWYNLRDCFMSIRWVLYLRIGFLFSDGVEICRLDLALRVGALFELVLISVGVDKPQGL
jgi:hypothetical protein